MIHRLILSPDAEEDICSAPLWYLRIGIDLPFRFGADLKATLSNIVRQPKRFSLVRGPLRRALMRRFPYAVYFKLSADMVDVVAVSHQRRLNPLRRP